jgi:hypothetical protein
LVLLWILALGVPYWLHEKKGWSDGQIILVLAPLLIAATWLTGEATGWWDKGGSVEDYCDVHICK